MLGLAIRQIHPNALSTIIPASPDRNIDTGTADLFQQIAKATSSAEHARTVGQLNERLAPCRRAEAQVLDSVVEELGAIRMLLQTAERSQLSRALTRYHLRRASAAPAILAAL